MADSPITPEEIASKREQLVRAEAPLRAEAWDWLQANAPLTVEELEALKGDCRQSGVKFELQARILQLREAAAPPPEPAPTADTKPQKPRRSRYEKTLQTPEERKEKRERTTIHPSRLVVSGITDIEEAEFQWLWPGRIPLGCLVAILGQMGTGKSTLLSWLAAQVTTGSSWPDSPEKSEPGDVLYLQAEESNSKSLRPRLRMFGADLSRIGVVLGVNRGEAYDDWFDLGRDIGRLAEECDRRERRVRLIVVDPLLSYLPRTNDNGGSDARRILQPAVQFAEDYNLTFLYTVHPNKDSEKSILDRMSGPGAYAQVARAAWFFSRDPNDKTGRMLSFLKGNIRDLRRSAKSVYFDEKKHRIAWLNREADLSAEDVNNLLLKQAREARAEGKRGPDPTEMKRAASFILEYLGRGPALQSVVQDQALNQGIKESSFRKALKHLVQTEGSVKRGRREDDQRFELSLISAPADNDAPQAPPGNRAPES